MSGSFTRRGSRGFLERSLAGLADALDHAAFADNAARRGGLLQGLDPRAKIVAFGALILAATGARRLEDIAAVFSVAAAVAALSGITPGVLLARAWLGVLLFTGVITLPAVFLTPGAAVARLPGLGWAVTGPGLLAAGRLVARAETTATLALTLILTTPWTHLLKALRVLRVPTVAVVILGMTHRYLFLLLHLAQDVFTARRSRLVGRLDPARQRQMAAGAAGALLGRSLQMSGEAYQAMQSRGFRGEARTLDDFRWRGRDGVAVAAGALVAAGVWWWGRE